MFTKIPAALEMSTSSISGHFIADSIARLARSEPPSQADPMTALPFVDMTERTSLKSRFISPGLVMTSAMPHTALNKTSLLAQKASDIFAPRPITSRSFSFGTTMSESTCADNSSSPASAARSRRS